MRAREGANRTDAALSAPAAPRRQDQLEQRGLAHTAVAGAPHREGGVLDDATLAGGVATEEDGSLSLAALRDRLASEEAEAESLEATLADATKRFEERKAEVVSSIDARRQKLNRMRTELNTLHARRLSELAAAAASLQLREQQFLSLSKSTSAGGSSSIHDVSGPVARMGVLESHIERLLEELREADAEAARIHERLAFLAVRDTAAAASATAALQRSSSAVDSQDDAAGKTRAADETTSSSSLAAAAAAAERRAIADAEAAAGATESPLKGHGAASDTVPRVVRTSSGGDAALAGRKPPPPPPRRPAAGASTEAEAAPMMTVSQLYAQVQNSFTGSDPYASPPIPAQHAEVRASARSGAASTGLGPAPAGRSGGRSSGHPGSAAPPVHSVDLHD